MVGYRGEGDLSSSESAVAGAVSGAVTRASASPLDILKIRFQLQIENMKQTGKGHLPKYTGVGQAVGLIWKEEGIKAFW
jgi:solute carrier family 25 thiamine pyrophosphate transporter 19